MDTDTEMTCHMCGKKATIEDVDPYIAELYPEEEQEEEWWCEECYQERLYDI